MDNAIKFIVDHTIVPVTSSIPWLISHWVLFALFGVLWIAFGVGIVASQGSLDATWEWLRGLPLLLQGIVWLLFLPVAAGLFIWETTWPLVLRLVLVLGLAGWSLLMFIPRATAEA
ncbi:MAG TPA: hypothetical protein VF484_06875 [Candidatus Limnocylindrales bacterium]